MEHRGGDRGGVEEDSVEYQLLKAYCAKRTTRTRLRHGGVGVHLQGPVLSDHTVPVPSIPTVQWRSMEIGTIMVKTQEDSLAPSAAVPCAVPEYWKPERVTFGGSTDSTFSGVVDRLAHIVDSVPIPEDEIETDSPDDHNDVVEKLVELLKKSGDQLNEQIKQNKVLQQQLLKTFDYSLFEKVTSCLLSSLDTWPGGRAAAPARRLHKEQVAWAFEVTSRLSSLDVIPKRRALGYGERYVRLHLSSWVREHGGWQKAFDEEDID